MTCNVTTRLQSIWFGLLSEDKASKSAAMRLWDIVKNHYREDVRHYHTLNHLQCIFDLQEEYKEKIKSHEAVSWGIFFHEFGDEDVHYFLDFDMQVLGWSDSDYNKYPDYIRQEYIHIPQQQYCMSRSNVLRTFLEMPNIFATKDLRDKYEAQARSNIKREIDLLQKQVNN